ncbi:MAG: c-type cytochrome [Halieaceae bacterium]|nr:c-type cytochrome [Halieaceae bacterium]
MSRKSALLALVALPLAATLHAQELSEEQRAEIAARIAPVGDVCLQGENCGGKPARSNTPTRASGTMASAPAAKPAAAADSEQADNAGEQQTEVAMAPADDTAEAVDAASTTGPETAAIDGEAIYNQACVACHASGVGGAPVVGDVDSWSPRIAKGIEALHNSGINGIAGTAMMAKGGRADLSDQQIMAAVDYMVGASQ